MSANPTSPVSRPTFWLRHDPAFCRSGDVFAQPLRAGLLQPGFSPSECGALDAPQYLPTGGIRASSQLSLTGTTLYVTEVADQCRELMAELAAEVEAEPDPYEGAYWGDEPIPVGEATESDFSALDALAADGGGVAPHVFTAPATC
jgi:hypothetical protein